MKEDFFPNWEEPAYKIEVKDVGNLPRRTGRRFLKFALMQMG